MKKSIVFILLLFACASFAQYYDIAVVRANDSVVQSLVYDDNATAYKDNGIENPDMNLRICANSSSDLLGRYVSLAYADGFDGDYIILTHFAAHVTNVTPSGCAYVALEISSFRAWYPSIPYVFISTSTNMDNADRWKLSRLRGWFIGNYTLNRTQAGNEVNITVTDAVEDTGASIVPDVNYLVVGLVRDDYTTMDTGITSPNDSILLYADSATAPYGIFINGIGPDLPPYVEIITPEPVTYATGTIPFTYIMFDDDDIASCWYILDGARVNMPVCGPAYILNVGQGSHTLTLYANDTTSNVASDSVTFQVGGVVPPGPSGGGPAGVPYPQPVPPPPPFLYFTIIPENIYITIDYPEEGSAGFSVTSTATLTDVECFVRGDFEEYATVELDSDTIPANGTISGTITVSMPPTDILDYNKSTAGVLQCTGKTDPTLISSTLANVYLILNKPVLEVENKTVLIIAGTMENETIMILNAGPGNATAVNVTAVFTDYQFLFLNLDVSSRIENGQIGYLRFIISIPEDMEPGRYVIPLDVYENGRKLGTGYLTLEVRAPQKPEFICAMPDLAWTIVILLLGLGTSVVAFRRKVKIEELRRISKILAVERKRESRWEKYKKPLGYALGVMAVFFIMWLLVFLALAKCTYVPADAAACVAVDPVWTLAIPLLGLFASTVIYRLKKEEEGIPAKKAEDEDEKNKRLLMYALGAFAVFFLAWLITVLFLLPRC